MFQLYPTEDKSTTSFTALRKNRFDKSLSMIDLSTSSTSLRYFNSGQITPIFIEILSLYSMQIILSLPLRPTLTVSELMKVIKRFRFRQTRSCFVVRLPCLK